MPPPSLGADVPVGSATDNIYPWMTDLGLMNHFTSVTSATLPGANLHTWRDKVPAVAADSPYLMHQILAVSAFHLAIIEPLGSFSAQAHTQQQQRQEKLSLALQHQHHAIRGVQSEISHVTPGNCDALFAASSLLFIGAFAASGPMLHSPLRQLEVDDILEVFTLIRGVSSVLASARENVRHGILKDFMKCNPYLGGNELLTLLQDNVSRIQGGLDQHDVSSEVKSIIGEAVLGFRNSIERASSITPELNVAVSWPMVLRDNFMALLVVRDPASLVVLAHYTLVGGPRQEHAAVALGDNIYVVAGIELDASQPTGVSIIDSVELYNIPKDEWSFAAPLPIPMNHANAAAANGKVYILGGLSGGAVFRALLNCYEYNPATNAWTELPPIPNGTERGSSILGVTGDRIIVAGSISLLELGEDGLQETVDTVSSYNFVTKEWESLPSLPEGREHAGGGVIGTNFYVVGGRFRSQTAVCGTVYVLDLKTLKWSERARIPAPRGGLSVAIVGQRIYTFGGEGNLDPEAGFVFNETEVYDARTNCWEKLKPMKTPCHGMAAVAYNGSVYTPGGGIRDFGIVDNMEVLHPSILSPQGKKFGVIALLVLAPFRTSK
ncbi:hypothetical protein COL5a_003863 [Colletotrichum fioriniae]|nr:hypothetical protein COL5a_003863 [Colletotrichum fioriniae]